MTQPLHRSQHTKTLGNTRIAYKPRHTHTPLEARKTQVAISDTTTHNPQRVPDRESNPWLSNTNQERQSLN